AGVIRLRIHGLAGMILLAAAMRPACAIAEPHRSSAHVDYPPLARSSPSGEPLEVAQRLQLKYALADRVDLTLSKGGDGRTPKGRRLEAASYLPARPSGAIKIRLAFRW
ncbi:MAG: hypothetical protein JWO33_256, partial [Caulobacteraceae bacterium]|nr:hypothetical protein [Caulobacteraceae bacterium]